MKIGVQTKNAVDNEDPVKGFSMLKEAGFSCCDFSLDTYLRNYDLYQGRLNSFFDRSVEGLHEYFTPHKDAARAADIEISQIHMPYPNYVPGESDELNDYLKNVVAPKSMEVCAFFKCPYIVVHGFKLSRYLGSEEAEWEKTSDFLEFLAPIAKEYGITICMENLYIGLGDHIVEGPCCDAKKAAERIDRMNDKFGAEVLGFCLDTGHANLVGIDIEDFIVTLGHRLKVFHIHDNDGIMDLHQIPFAFTRSRENTSSTDWDGFIRGLKRINYAGNLCFETGPVLSAFPDVMKQDVLQFIARIGKYFVGEISH